MSYVTARERAQLHALATARNVVDALRTHRAQKSRNLLGSASLFFILSVRQLGY